MKPASLLDPLVLVSSPPPGAVNVRVGLAIEGPGGRWVPCATEVAGVYFPGLFRVGAGYRQVCASDVVLSSADEALERAIELASTAAA